MQLLAGLNAAHRARIVHRDVKPGNIFLMKSTTPISIVKLLDFGMAQPPPETASVTTRPGVIYGTPGYVAPEVLFGARADLRSDLWAVGVVLFEMLAGVPAFDHRAGFGASRERPPSIRAQVRDIGHHLAAIVDQAIAADPNTRFQSALDFYNALDDLAHDATEFGSATSSLQVDVLFPVERATGTLPALELTPPSGSEIAGIVRGEDTEPDWVAPPPITPGRR